MIKYLGLLFKIACPVLEIRHTAKKYLKHPERNQNGEFFYYIQRKIKKVIDKRIKVKWIISGQENIPADSNYLLVGNHQSNFDPVFLVAESKKEMTFVSKKENFDFFFLTPILTALNCIPMDRSSLKDEVRAIKTASELLKNKPGLSLGIYPEGTRSKDPNHEIQEFKPGALKPAFNASKPIVPIAIWGGFRILDKKFRMKSYPVQVTYLKPISVEEINSSSTVEISKKIENMIKEEVEKMRKLDSKYLEECKVITKKLPVLFKGI